jgi:Mrp family chromosome partitioning ATPase
MSGSLVNEIELISQIAESKRTYGAIDTFLAETTPACLVVTSSVPSEGKTTVVATLAAIAAHKRGARVLAMDLNWYAPSLHHYFGLEQTFDASALTGNRQVTGLVQRSGMNGLDILTAATPRESEFTLQTELSTIGAEMVEQARQSYDLTIIDTAAVSPTNRHMMDPVSLAAVADGTVLVVLANVTPRHWVKRAHMALEMAGARVIGAIVNQWKNPLF